MINPTPPPPPLSIRHKHPFSPPSHTKQGVVVVVAMTCHHHTLPPATPCTHYHHTTTPREHRKNERRKELTAGFRNREDSCGRSLPLPLSSPYYSSTLNSRLHVFTALLAFLLGRSCALKVPPGAARYVERGK
ncbi:hypothetical protein E2C01_085436 [Portunus trituberculatus]|uniref:Uncharacterized protein n=1 Tax=Portunus trituberculatus TaxID=210409 RepID=A0A5B7JBX2_PORTR|nr:hypothetical protein [Portunus trituberculatus]